jgi:hypothetical protein
MRDFVSCQNVCEHAYYSVIMDPIGKTSYFVILDINETRGGIEKETNE